MTDLIALPPPVTQPAPVVIPMTESGPDTPPLPLGQASGLQGDGSFLFRQAVPAELWEIAHGLGRYPSVTVQDTIGELTSATVEHINVNTLRIRFGAPCWGFAYLSR